MSDTNSTFSYYPSPYGIIQITCNTNALLFLQKVEQIIHEESDSVISTITKKQLNEYFEGTRRTFDLPLELHGTDFQMKVWKALREIPYGEIRSYKEIAIAVGNEKASRAVGMANNRNPIFIIIPCHRVIGSNNTLVGYAGGLAMKQGLLELEARNSFSLA